MSKLDTELAYFKEKKADWLKLYKNHFALIKGRELLDTYTTFEEAFEAGIDKLGNQPFLIKEITEQELEVQHPALSVGMLHAHF